MAHRVLGGGADLAEGHPERRVVEDGVVAEAAVAPRGFQDEALHRALDGGLAAVRSGDRDHRAVAGGPPRRRHAGQFLQHHRVTLGVGQAFAPVPRRQHPGSAPEGVHLDARVVGQRHVAGGASDGAGLAQGVVGVGYLALGGQHHVRIRGEILDAVGNAREERGQLPTLRPVARGEDQQRVRG